MCAAPAEMTCLLTSMPHTCRDLCGLSLCLHGGSCSAYICETKSDQGSGEVMQQVEILCSFSLGPFLLTFCTPGHLQLPLRGAVARWRLQDLPRACILRLDSS